MGFQFLDLPAHQALPHGQRMHPRYVVTEKGSVHYDYGLDHRPRQQSLVTLLDDSYHRDLVATFDSDALPADFARDEWVWEFIGRQGIRHP